MHWNALVCLSACRPLSLTPHRAQTDGQVERELALQPPLLLCKQIHISSVIKASTGVEEIPGISCSHLHCHHGKNILETIRGSSIIIIIIIFGKGH